MPYYDSKTDNDFTTFRVYSPNLGRWFSPDPGNVGAHPPDPQTWNMYAYVRNNPTSLIDPSGLSLAQLCTVNIDCYNVDTDVLSQNGFDITYDSNGKVTGASYSGAGVNFVDSNGNVLGTLGADTNFTLTSRVEQQSVTVTPDTMSDVTASLVMSPMSAYGGPMAPSAQRMLHAIAEAAPTLCGGGVFGYAGAAGKLGVGEGFMGGLAEYDSRSGGSMGPLAEAGSTAGSAGVALTDTGFQPFLFIPAGPVGAIGGLVLGESGVGFYAGTPVTGLPVPSVGGGAYLNFTTNAGCR
jgi:RHS repeat-associated protein